jgi:pyruvate kinase
MCVLVTLTVARWAHLHRGVVPCLFTGPECQDPAHWQEDVDARLRFGVKVGCQLGLLSETKNETVILIQGWSRGSGHTNALRIISTAEWH